MTWSGVEVSGVGCMRARIGVQHDTCRDKLVREIHSERSENLAWETRVAVHQVLGTYMRFHFCIVFSPLTPTQTFPSHSSSNSDCNAEFQTKKFRFLVPTLVSDDNSKKKKLNSKNTSTYDSRYYSNSRSNYNVDPKSMSQLWFRPQFPLKIHLEIATIFLTLISSLTPTQIPIIIRISEFPTVIPTIIPTAILTPNPALTPSLIPSYFYPETGP